MRPLLRCPLVMNSRGWLQRLQLARLETPGEVPPRAFDMLLDRLPWGYVTIRFPWMPEVLHVDWR
jgi:hypothetical protein